jgi:hypothetical protein
MQDIILHPGSIKKQLCLSYNEVNALKRRTFLGESHPRWFEG